MKQYVIKVMKIERIKSFIYFLYKELKKYSILLLVIVLQIQIQ